MSLVFNANVVDGKEEKTYLAALLLDGSDFNNCEKYKIKKIIKQDKLIKENDKILSVYAKEKKIDFNGDCLFPAFIDMHCHSEFLYMKNPATDIRREDFIATEVDGNCGVSVFPIAKDKGKEALLKQSVLSILGSWPKDEKGKDYSWHSFAEFQKLFKSLGVKNDFYFLQGHAALRIAAMDGNPNRKAGKDEILRMQNLLDDALTDGAVGLSTGLYYAPCVFSDNAELLSLLEIVKKHNAVFAIHRREEGNAGFESTAEAIELARRSGARLEISHLKAVGSKNQNQVDKILQLIGRAKSEGMDIAFDQYPYTFGSTSLASLLPPDVSLLGEDIWKKKLADQTYRLAARKMIDNPEGYESIIELVGFDNIFIQSSDTFPEFINKSFTEIAKMTGKDPYDAFFDILCAEKGVCTMKDTVQSEENLLKIMKHPLSLFGTDGLFAGSTWHPRGTQAGHLMLEKYSKVLGLEKVVSRATYKAAKQLNLKNEFVIKENVVLPLVRFASFGL